MKRTIIPAGTPGTFRPGHGEYPELGTTIIGFRCRNKLFYSRHFLEVSELNDPFRYGFISSVYAWQYAPVAPPVEGLEAFKAGWSNGPEIYSGHGYRYHAANGLLVDGYNIVPKLRQIENFPTLAAAQEAAYKHFLSTLND